MPRVAALHCERGTIRWTSRSTRTSEALARAGAQDPRAIASPASACKRVEASDDWFDATSGRGCAAGEPARRRARRGRTAAAGSASSRSAWCSSRSGARSRRCRYLATVVWAACRSTRSAPTRSAQRLLLPVCDGERLLDRGADRGRRATIRSTPATHRAARRQRLAPRRREALRARRRTSPTRILVPARTGDGDDRRLPRRSARAGRRRSSAASARAASRVDACRLAGAAVDGRRRARRPARRRARSLDWTVERALAGLCAIQLGVARRGAAPDRRVHLGSASSSASRSRTFQAVAQRAADAYIDTEAIRSPTGRRRGGSRRGCRRREEVRDRQVLGRRGRPPRRARRAAPARRHRRRHRLPAAPLLPLDEADRAHARRRRACSSCSSAPRWPPRRSDRGVAAHDAGTLPRARRAWLDGFGLRRRDAARLERDRHRACERACRRRPARGHGDADAARPRRTRQRHPRVARGAEVPDPRSGEDRPRLRARAERRRVPAAVRPVGERGRQPARDDPRPRAARRVRDRRCALRPPRHAQHADGRCSSSRLRVERCATARPTTRPASPRLLAIGTRVRRLAEAPRRSVVLALWDAEEDGLLGSLYYVDHPARAAREDRRATSTSTSRARTCCRACATRASRSAPRPAAATLRAIVDGAVAAERLDTSV